MDQQGGESEDNGQVQSHVNHHQAAAAAAALVLAAHSPSTSHIPAPPPGAGGATAGSSHELITIVNDNSYNQQQQKRGEIEMRQRLRKFWENQIQEIKKTIDFKNHSLPLARIKKIMKADEDVKMISAEAPMIFAKACEMFILELTLRSWSNTEHNKRRTLLRNDVTLAISQTDIFDFLVDIIPRDHENLINNTNRGDRDQDPDLEHEMLQQQPLIFSMPPRNIISTNNSPLKTNYYNLPHSIAGGAEDVMMNMNSRMLDPTTTTTGAGGGNINIFRQHMPPYMAAAAPTTMYWYPQEQQQHNYHQKENQDQEQEQQHPSSSSVASDSRS